MNIDPGIKIQSHVGTSAPVQRKPDVNPQGATINISDSLVKSSSEDSPGLIPDLRAAMKSAPIEDKKETIPVKDLYITLAGSPGAGKSTQGALLSARYGIPHVSIGKALRKEISDGTVLGMMVKPYVERGDLAPAHLVAAVVKNRLSQPDCKNGYILDGYPRKMEDAKVLDEIFKEMGIKNFRMVAIEVNPDVVIERLKYRRVCDNGHEYDLKSKPPKKEGVCDEDGLPLKQRDDDKPETIKHRFEVYRNETLPVMEYYKSKGAYVKVDGSGNIDNVSGKLTDLLDPKEEKPDKN